MTIKIAKILLAILVFIPFLLLVSFVFRKATDSLLLEDRKSKANRGK